MQRLYRIENAAVRIMYFFNITDTFLPFSLVLYLCAAGLFFPCPGAGLSPAFLLKVSVYSALLYACCLIAEFHVAFLVALPLAGLAGLMDHGLDWNLVKWTILFFFTLTSAVQIAFMGVPMGMAARTPLVPLRMYLNSFIILAPTTISLPVTLGYQMFAATGLMVLTPHPLSARALGLTGILFLVAAAVRLLKKGPRIQPTYHPLPPPGIYRRVILLNIDGLSYHAFSRARAPFLRRLEEKFLHAAGGATTVYKAFTNPAFASILTGTPPRVHGVTNNNFGQAIRVQALPDIMPSRLYGSMHVKHFSRPSWNVNLVSLVAERYDRADGLLLEKMKTDVLRFPDTALWIMDFSMADFCGHAWGGYSRQYYGAVEKLDALIAGFFNWCGEKGLMKDTLFVISSDHGLFIGEHAYLLSRQEKYVPLVFVGRGVPPGALEQASILDIAANLCYALGKPYPASAAGRVFPSMAGYRQGPSFEERLGCMKRDEG